MLLSSLVLLAQLAATVPQQPVLAFPDVALDDTAAYQGYRTRFHRDAGGNTIQIYLDPREARVVHVLANGDNESIGFSARSPEGRAAPLRWHRDGALVGRDGRSRTVEYSLVADVPALQLGWFLLGSMRVERDFQAWGRHRAPFGAAPFALAETDALLAALGRLDPATRRVHLSALHAPTLAALRARLQPTVTAGVRGTRWEARVVQPSIDGRDTLSLTLRADPRRLRIARAGGTVSLRSRAGDPIHVTVRIASTAPSLSPLSRDEIFTPDFLRFLADARAAGDGPAAVPAAQQRARWLERQVRGVELLASREKLMAGMPTYATYFGRDMLMTALMMRPIWRPEMSEAVIGSVLRKLSPTDEVSHEEALGGQAVREGAAEYAALVTEATRRAMAGGQPAADSLRSRALDVLRNIRRVRENYHMIDDELQLPVLAARWLTDPQVPDARKRAFLLDTSDGGGTRLSRLVRELAVVAAMATPYAADPVAAHLVAFARRDSVRWAATSWRDSNAGYANGRFAMDVNTVWMPHALEALQGILATLRGLSLPVDSIVSEIVASAPARGGALHRYATDTLTLRAAIDTWWGAERHFVVRLSPSQVQARVDARLAVMPSEERRHWEGVIAASGAAQDSLTFLALALDAEGAPIGVLHTDAATRLFLGDGATGLGGGRNELLRDVRHFTRHYPAGLFIDAVGPVAANDAFASPDIWSDFLRDPYHGPRVVWGREVNLFLLGVAQRLGAASESIREPGGLGEESRAELRVAIDAVQRAVEASGFRSELWSYEFRDGRPFAVRYGSGGDIQLWSTTDLVVQWAVAQLGPSKAR